MKLFKALQIQNIEKSDINSGRVSSLALMDRAINEFYYWLVLHINKRNPLVIISGIGNNGADGLALAKKLDNKGFKTTICIVGLPNKGSKEFKYHFTRILGLNSIEIKRIDVINDLIITENQILIDALFGNGINRPLTGIYLDVVKAMNSSGNDIYSIDLPSGMYSDYVSYNEKINATGTFSFEFPKLSFFASENQTALGHWDFKSIGLSKKIILETKSKIHLIDSPLIRSIIKQRSAFGHKGNYGHLQLIAGSSGMAGASILAAKAAIISGVGLCTVISSKENRIIIQSSVPEAMFKIINNDIVYDKKKTIAIGPGLGLSEISKKITSTIIELVDKPIVIDADALNILSEFPELINNLCQNSILTPHPKEFLRLFGYSGSSDDSRKLQLKVSIEYKLVIVLKGHYTTISTPDGQLFYNNTGNVGMATGGSGDVLTGIIASFLAQGYSPINAALLGVYFHGLSGDLYVESSDMLSLTPEKLIDNLKNAFSKYNL